MRATLYLQGDVCLNSINIRAVRPDEKSTSYKISKVEILNQRVLHSGECIRK